jgi:hypothetical protein
MELKEEIIRLLNIAENRYNNLSKLKQDIDNMVFFEVAIEKSTGDIVTLRYDVNSDGNIMVSTYYPNASLTRTITYDHLLREYVEYSPSTRAIFRRP